MNQGTDSIRGLEPGTYKLFAVPTSRFRPPPHHFNGAYTKGLACGLASGCNDKGL